MMRHIRFDSVGGASGDMILGALAGLGLDMKEIEESLKEALPGEDFQISVVPHSDHGISGQRAEVKILRDSTHERGMHEIGRLISASALPEAVKESALNVFTRLAEAEARVHGCDPHHIHFHEVGAVDSIVDIVGSCLGVHKLKVSSISFGPLPEGRGTFKCRHGIYPIPAPATAELLKGSEIVQTEEPFELVTPTGAALLTSLPGAEKPFSGRIIESSCAFGSRKLEGRPNLLRATLMESAKKGQEADGCILLETNLDDISAELTGALYERLFAEGALDVWTVPALMKKQRQGMLLSVLCRAADQEKIQTAIFTETGTFGVRFRAVSRHVLERKFIKVETPFGTVGVKAGILEGRVVSLKPEYEDCLRLAKLSGAPLKEVMQEAVSAARA